MWELTVLLIAGAYVGWNIGANDAGNCIGTTVGSGLLTYRKAILLVSTFAILGAALQGGNVMKTVGKGIVTTELPAAAIFAALIASGLFVTLATFCRVPVSTSQAIVGGVAGVGLAVGATVNFSELITIAEVWVVCPFLTALLSFAIYRGLAPLFRRIERFRIYDSLLKALLIASSAYVSFSMGANNVGNAMGPIANLGITYSWLGLLGGVALAVGTLTFGHRVTETIGGGITQLDPFTAFCAQASAAFAIHFFSIIGIPVSTSQAVVGAIVGVAFVKGVRAIHGRKVAEILIGWVVTPLTAGLLSFGLYKVIALFV